ncbi:hypothetical protein DO97_17070 [Neosynechococcus sphagnicola sy1]|uniref:Uncharacterized protein n=1 Tax=Neosynechococcus sphagnicola sy1 TaxID=1497020 RepID=A0A098TGF2_9CYAN|nr:hypothetical protein [Neosynechococcus sphagnicola]KGF71645.1 hypothetical protein DO97_17070 [Neosynechococcus sphagnicola sy1]
MIYKLSKAIANSGQILTVTLGVLLSQGKLILYPLVSLALTILITFTVLSPLFKQVLASEVAISKKPQLFGLFCILYLLISLIITVSNVALITTISARLEGDRPSLISGLVRVAQKVLPICRYAILTTLLNLIYFLLRNTIGFFLWRFLLPPYWVLGC